ncbi:chemotaxis protein CheW [Gemmatimonas aurantiaca]|uniref:chemotaxis protein CheW n=1 Tax=Gemmatimonas aurantiaca TaxID=173480 RepID=UPI00301C9CAC
MNTSRFRSVREIAGDARTRRGGRRARPLVERSTFVIVSLGGDRMALPVEGVERVVRPFSSLPVILYEGRQLPFADLARPLGRTLRLGEGDQRRVLVLTDGERRWAAPVDAVNEVVTVETALVLPVPVEHPDAHVAGVPGCFARQEHTIPVIDALGILSRTAAARART